MSLRGGSGSYDREGNPGVYPVRRQGKLPYLSIANQRNDYICSIPELGECKLKLFHSRMLFATEHNGIIKSLPSNVKTAA
ncbi:MAG: hypothetical protein FVQ80_18630 [Planctomycetes bacterium]|nr:hypothetical protein [Planctomycetota bacterium]